MQLAPSRGPAFFTLIRIAPTRAGPGSAAFFHLMEHHRNFHANKARTRGLPNMTTFLRWREEFLSPLSLSL